MRTIEFVREHGYLCSYNQLLPGVGAVSCPLPMPHAGEQLAITVAGSSERIERRGRQIINTLLRDLQAFQSTGGLPSKDATAVAAPAVDLLALATPPAVPAVTPRLRVIRASAH
jgi:histidine ammonia-lyase